MRAKHWIGWKFTNGRTRVTGVEEWIGLSCGLIHKLTLPMPRWGTTTVAAVRGKRNEAEGLVWCFFGEQLSLVPFCRVLSTVAINSFATFLRYLVYLCFVLSCNKFMLTRTYRGFT